VILGVVAVVVIVLVALLAIPVSHSFSARIASSDGSPVSQEFTFPSGAPVSGSWTSVGGVDVTFEVSGLTGTVDSSYGSSGTFAFSSAFALYFFGANGTGPFTVQISGTYSAPIA
jgi:hypothetical protein